MRYGKKISAILAAAMVFSSVSCFAAVADITDVEASLADNEIVSVAELDEQIAEDSNINDSDTEELTIDADETEEISADDEEVELEADKVTVTVNQVTGGTITVSEKNGEGLTTVNIKGNETASTVIQDLPDFKLTAPGKVNSGTDSSGSFPDNKEITSNYFEFRNSESREVEFEAINDGVLTIYARAGNSKNIVLKNLDTDTTVESLITNIVTTTGSGGDLVGTVQFDTKVGKYQFYVAGGTGRLFGITYEVKSENESTKSIEVVQGTEVKIDVEPGTGYELSKILVDGEEIKETVFTADKDVTVSAEFKIDSALVESVDEFFETLEVPEVIPADTTSLTLPAVAIEGTTIEWTSSNPAVVGVDGKINNPIGADATVTLTAVVTIAANGEEITKDITVTVPGVDLKEEFDKKDFGIRESVTEDFVVDSEFLGQKLTWTSSEENIEFGEEANENGRITATVNRPHYVDGDKTVVITATVANPNGDPISKTYTVTVPAYENSGEHSTANLILSRIELEGNSEENGRLILTSNIDLPTTDSTYGGKITWASSNPKVVSNTGIVSRPSGGDVTVRLTAIVECDGNKASDEFTVTVRGKNTSGGGGGGGSYTSSGYGSTYSSNTGGVSANYVDYSALQIDANINTDETAPVFTDIAEYGWAASHINRLVNKGVVKGIGDNKFNPEGLVTREQFATMLVRAFNFTGNTATSKKFDDVESGAYYEEAIAILSSMGVINGQSETTFGVGQGISRQDMAVMCALATKVDNNAEVGEFNDAADIAGYAVDSVNKMKRCGILAGDENNNFNPRNNATRAEAAKIISVMMDFVETSGAN